MNSVTKILQSSHQGDGKKTDQLFTVLYEDLRKMAGRFLQSEPVPEKLSSASLVHQAYVRMVDQNEVNWQGKTHFFAIGATVMRRILVDHARRTRALKRGGNWLRRQLDDEVTFVLDREDDVVALDELLLTLAELSPRQAKVVELRFFGGLAMKEIAAELNIGLRTVEKEWAMARAWLRRELRDVEEPDDANERVVDPNDVSNQEL
ncbi:RNA polymerase, sigma subunit, ECF family [Neorhodopirellula lusitana]|uniref:RNA polymerase, sigma subunit, ECF family n=1 Tax=Neorhodopirellula lusitana TaxID=445327 RepID=A0ABY1Q3R9_9BACT|nr:sigma-70 family RNA polymerase sigma factor [Neorhodopirellula lusitana]SMP58494.1 RNA polymerase, sigma subunit, ECF family [Neorhodopirellula lusitana]